MVIYRAPSPGGPVEVFEVPPTPTSSDLSGGTPPVNGNASLLRQRNPFSEIAGPSAASSSPNGGEVTSANLQFPNNHSSEGSDSWIEKWFNRKVVNDEGQEATSQPTGTGVMEQGDAGSSKIAPQGPQPQPSDPLAIRERESCESIKARIIELPRIREELDKAEHYSPGITEKLNPSRAIDLIMDDIIPSEQAKRGIQEGATLKEIRCYKHWLNRVEYGTDPKFYTPGPQSKINDIDIQDRIEPFYRKHS